MLSPGLAVALVLGCAYFSGSARFDATRSMPLPPPSHLPQLSVGVAPFDYKQEQLKATQSVALFQEPARHLTEECKELVRQGAASKRILEKLADTELTTFTASSSFTSSLLQVGHRLLEALESIPIHVGEHIAEMVAEQPAGPLIIREYISDDSTGIGYFFDVSLHMAVAGEQVAVSVLVSGVSFPRRAVVLGFSEEHEPVILNRKIQGRLLTRADCGIRTERGGRCSFPFVYEGLTHTDCIPAESGASWCATEVDARGEVRSWDLCTSAKYFEECTEANELYGATFEVRSEPHHGGTRVKQVPILSPRALPQGVDQDQVMNALKYQAARDFLDM